MLALVLALAATVVDAPCGLVDDALERDRRVPADAVLREAAAEAESAGDILLAARLLARLRDRTSDAAVASEAAFMLETLDLRAAAFSCRGLTRDVLVYFDPASLLSDKEREVIAGNVGDELDRRDITAFVEPGGAFEDCIDLDDRCVRLILAERRLGGVIRLKGIRIDDTVTVEVTAVGFPGRADHRFMFTGHHDRWDNTLDRVALDDLEALMPKGAGRASRVGDSAVNPAIAGVTAIGLGLMTAGVGGAIWLDPGLVGLVGVDGRAAREQWQTGGLVAVGVGSGVMLISGIALALIVDARNDG